MYEYHRLARLLIINKLKTMIRKTTSESDVVLNKFSSIVMNFRSVPIHTYVLVRRFLG